MIGKKIKVLLSTNGPVKFIKTAESVSKYVDISVVQGFLPGKFSKKILIPIFNKIVGRDLSKSFDKRMPKALEGHNYSNPIGEFYSGFCNSLKKKFKIKFKHTASKSLSLYGNFSRRKITKEYDIFHVRSGSGQGGAIEKAKKNGMKILVHHTIAHPNFLKKLGFDDFNTDLWDAVYDDCKKADALLVNSDFVKETFVAEGWDPNKINVVYSGVAEEFIGLKNCYDITDTLKIIYTGGFSNRKGCGYIIEALKQLQQEKIPISFKAYGSFDEKLANQLPIGCSCEGHVYKDELKKKLAEADIYLFPSLAEGCAASAMEALAAGVPCILTKETGTPAQNNEHALIVPARDVKAIVDAIHELKSSYELRERLGNAAMNLAKQYSWQKHGEKVYEVYKNILSINE